MDNWLSSEWNCIVVFVFRSAALPNFYKEQSLCPRQLARGLPKLWGITLTRSKLWNFILPFLNSNIFNYQHLTFCTELLWGTLLWIITGSVEERKIWKKFFIFLEKMVAFQLILCLPKNKDILSGHQTPTMTRAIAHWIVVSNIKKQRVQWLLFW